MKKLMIMAVAAIVLSFGTARADLWIGDVNNPVDPSVYQDVFKFDWSSSGSGVAIGTGPFGTTKPIGTQFDFLYQSYLTSFRDQSGQTIPTPSLNATHEFTMVAKIPEIQLNAPSGPLPTTTFGTDPAPPLTSRGNSWAIYYDGTGVGGIKANVLAGTGFNDGRRIAYGTFVAPETTTSLTKLSSKLGVGSMILTGLVSWVDPVFFSQAPQIIEIRLEGTVNYPPLDSTTKGFFDGKDGFVRYTKGTKDILYKVDGSSGFEATPVPIPPAAWLLGTGLIGMVGVRRRMRK